MKPKKESNISKARLRSSFVTSIISISLVLFMIGILGLLILNAKKVSDYVKENIGVSIIIEKDTKEVDIIQLQKMLDAKNYVKETKYVTETEAAKIMEAELGEDFLMILGSNPLLASIDVKLYADYANTDSIAKIEQEFASFPQIKEVYYQKSLVHLINENVKKITIILLSFSILLLFISLTLINNTIRLSIYSKRFIISTMQIVGATNGFIRKPFLKSSVLLGVLGGIIASILVGGVIYLAENEMTGVISLNDIEIITILFASLIVIGVIINWLSTYFAVTKYLKMKIDRLYF